ncbi:nuclear envelope pore membrane protein POM 121 [Bubalus bubalis]|uniref:nuclear envelope pore membrane protein POM 121 n=1 Tax=Bubalus bubalis TaxID=89462 RepID=UPI00042D0672|nr:nuclear envelope pore membrane protein POM 121 [Bubalus bubalis]
MGGCLSRPRPRQSWSPALRGGDQPESTECLGPAHTASRVPPACRVHSGAPTLDLARRLSYEGLMASPRRRLHRRGFVLVHRRQYSIQQARCLFWGFFPSVPRSGRQKPLPSACSSKMFHTSVILRMASAKGKLTLRLPLKQTVICTWSSFSVHLPNLCVKEILVRALEESGQLRGKEEKDLTALAESRKGLAKQKKGQSAQESQDKQRRGSNPGGNAQSAFRRLIINGVLSSFVPRPGPLVLCSKSSEDILIRKSQTYFLSSCSKRNAITSSYSSTRGFLQLQRMGPGAAGLLGPESSHLHEVSDKTREECHRPNPSVSMEPQRKIEDEKIADDHLRKKQNLNCSQSSDSSRPRKRKIPLLLPTRRNGPLILPPPLQIGYPVTAEDLDLEKRAAIQWINNILEG